MNSSNPFVFIIGISPKFLYDLNLKSITQFYFSLSFSDENTRLLRLRKPFFYIDWKIHAQVQLFTGPVNPSFLNIF